MNLEVELLKKEVQSLRNELNQFRQEFEDSKKSKYYRLTYTFLSETTLDVKNYLKKWKESYPDAVLHYVYSSHEDPTYTNAALKIHVYKHLIHLYIQLTNPELPETMEQILSTQPKQLKMYSTLAMLQHDFVFEKNPICL